MLLEIKELTKHFGGLTAINNFNLGVNQLEIVGLIGPNGAGKTTLFNLITGVYGSNGGNIIFDGKDITKMSPHNVASLGIGRTFQLNPLFNEFTVLENVLASFHIRPKSHLWDIFFNTPNYRKNETLIKAKSLEVLQTVGLDKVKDELARNLPYGYQKMLGIARALATQPKLLLLDEPLGGMNPSEIELCLNRLRTLREDGITILIVEHNMQILDFCDRIAVISFGQKICEGSPKEVRENEEVISAYFGGENVA